MNVACTDDLGVPRHPRSGSLICAGDGGFFFASLVAYTDDLGVPRHPQSGSLICAGDDVFFFFLLWLPTQMIWVYPGTHRVGRSSEQAMAASSSSSSSLVAYTDDLGVPRHPRSGSLIGAGADGFFFFFASLVAYTDDLGVPRHPRSGSLICAGDGGIFFFASLVVFFFFGCLHR